MAEGAHQVPRVELPPIRTWGLALLCWSSPPLAPGPGEAAQVPGLRCSDSVHLLDPAPALFCAEVGLGEVNSPDGNWAVLIYTGVLLCALGVCCWSLHDR